MEFLEGYVDFSVFVEENGTLDDKETAVVIFQMAHAVNYLHWERIAHRDIKPQNVMIWRCSSGISTKLIDFNISKKNERKQKKSAFGDRKFSLDVLNEEFGKNFSCKFLTHIGSPYYQAPEISQFGFYSESIDIWGIGLICAFSKFGEAFFKKDKKVKGTEEEDDSTDSEG